MDLINEFLKNRRQMFESIDVSNMAEHELRNTLKELEISLEQTKDWRTREQVEKDILRVKEELQKKEKKESKLSEQDDEEFPEEEPIETPEVEEPKEEPAEEPAPEEAEKEMPKIEKIYIGKTEDTHFYMIPKETKEGQIEDLHIVDQEGTFKYSAKDHNIDLSDIPRFLSLGIQELEIQNLEFGMFSKYLLPILLEEDKVKEEELEELPVDLEKQGEEVPEEPVESKNVNEDRIENIPTIELEDMLKSGKELIKTAGAAGLEIPGINGVKNIVKKVENELDRRSKEKKTEGKEPTESKKVNETIKKLDYITIDASLPGDYALNFVWRRGERAIGEFSDKVEAIEAAKKIAEVLGVEFREPVESKKKEEKVSECVCHIYEMEDDELIEFYRNMDKSYWDEYGKRIPTYESDKADVKKEIETRGLKVEGKIPNVNKDTEEKKIKKLIELKVTDDKNNTFDVHVSGTDEQSTSININGRDFNFSNEFVDLWRDEQGLSEEGLRELALDALANLDEKEYSELVTKTKSEEEEVEKAFAKQPKKETEKTELDRLVARRDELKAKEDTGNLTPDMQEELAELDRKIKKLGGAIESKSFKDKDMKEKVDKEKLAIDIKNQLAKDLLGKSFDELDDNTKKSIERSVNRAIEDVSKEQEETNPYSLTGEELKKAELIAKRGEGQYKKEAKEDKLPGGLADKSKPEDFDPEQLKMGIEVEMEHTDNPETAKEIAMDHLKEDPEYYTKLKRMEAGKCEKKVREKSDTDIPQEILDQAKEYHEERKMSYEEIVDNLLDNSKYKRWFDTQYSGNEFDLRQELEDVLECPPEESFESKTNEVKLNEYFEAKGLLKDFNEIFTKYKFPEKHKNKIEQGRKIISNIVKYAKAENIEEDYNLPDRGIYLGQDSSDLFDMLENQDYSAALSILDNVIEYGKKHGFDERVPSKKNEIIEPTNEAKYVCVRCGSRRTAETENKIKCLNCGHVEEVPGEKLSIPTKEIKTNEITEPTKPEDAPGTYNVTFADGHTETVTNAAGRRDAIEKAKKAYTKDDRVTMAKLVKGEGSDVETGLETWQVTFLDGHKEKVQARTGKEAMDKAKEIYKKDNRVADAKKLGENRDESKEMKMIESIVGLFFNK